MLSRTDITKYSNGQIRQEIRYLNGLKHGLEKSWHRNGQPDRVIPYIQGERHGQAFWWDDTGQLISQAFYNNGKLHGIAKRCSSWDLHFRFGFFHNGTELIRITTKSTYTDIPKQKLLFNKSQWKTICAQAPI